MKVNFDHSNRVVIVTLTEDEATRVTAFINTGVRSSGDPDADLPAQLEDALTELLS